MFFDERIDPFFNINTPQDIMLLKEYLRKMKIIGVVGWKNSGKTTLIEKLINEFNNRSLTVSTIKHSHHNFSVDKRNRLFRHFDAGTKETILASEKKWMKFSRQLSDSKINLP